MNGVLCLYSHANPADVVFLEIIHSIQVDESPDDQQRRMEELCDAYDVAWIALHDSWTFVNFNVDQNNAIILKHYHDASIPF